MGQLYIEVGMRIREERKKRKLTQLALATESGVMESYMSDIENGKAQCSLEKFVRIANALQVPSDLLLYGRVYATPVYDKEYNEAGQGCDRNELMAMTASALATRDAIRRALKGTGKAPASE